MKKTLVLAVFLAALGLSALAADEPKKPSPTPYEPSAVAKVAVLQAIIAQKDAQLALLTDSKYTAMINAGIDVTTKSMAACPEKDGVSYRLNITNLTCEPVK